MVFSSTIFLFVFLPIVLLLYFTVVKKHEHRNILLFLVSLVFYVWGEPSFVFIMLLSISINYILGKKIEGKTGREAKLLLITMLMVNLGILGVFKYTGFIVENVNQLLNLEISVPEIALPIGISFFTFQSISYVIDVYRGNGEALKNPLDVGLYIAFFPQLVAGPIVRYETIEKEIKVRQVTVEDFSEGIRRFIIGLAKKVLFANQMALVAEKAYSLGAENLSISFAWFGAVAYMLQILFDFSGYSDMAIGLGRMFGFHFNENFRTPYCSKSISEFWRRWHISLGSWFRDYVYFPLGGSRVNRAKLIRNLLIVWLLTGVWHGADWTFMAWGIYFGMFIILEKLTGFGKWLESKKGIGHIYTILIVLFGWILFRASSISEAAGYIGAMFGTYGNKFTTGIGTLYIRENYMMMFIAVLACTPIGEWLTKLFNKENNKIQWVFEGISTVCLYVVFIISIAYLVKGAYNPFIYFNF